MKHSAKTIGRRELLGRGASVAALAAVAAIPRCGVFRDPAPADAPRLQRLFAAYEEALAELYRRMDVTDAHAELDTDTDEIWQHQFAAHKPIDEAFMAICAYRCRTPDERRIKAEYMLTLPR